MSKKPKPAVWGSPVEVERRNRIRLTLSAYAYERGWPPIMDDAEWDALALKIRPEMNTDHPVLDAFFRDTFSPDTGQWVHDHPEHDKLERAYLRGCRRWYKNRELPGYNC